MPHREGIIDPLGSQASSDLEHERLTETRRIAVIGSNSFSGSDLIDLLLEDEANQIIGISRSSEKSAAFLPYKRHESGRFRFHRLDLNKESSAIIDLLDGFEALEVDCDRDLVFLFKTSPLKKLSSQHLISILGPKSEIFVCG